jgi:nitrite reductase/ring-hydroxylating ferredoxin subunit
LVHAVSNTASLGLFAASWAARISGRRSLGLGLSLAGVSCVSLGGWLGGHLVYALGVGVDTTIFEERPEDWTDAAAESEVTMGELTTASVSGVTVVMTKLPGGRIVAYADRCTYRGAPLHEGELVDGSIRCPWHGCRFSVEDGSIVQGPATRPQPAYDVRVNNERVEIRRRDDVRALRANPVGS